MLYLTTKALHLILGIAAFAGVFYLPRILVYLAEQPDASTTRQLLIMGRRLYRFTHWLLLLLLAAGIAMLVQQPQFLREGWMHAKLTVILLLFAHLHIAAAHLRRFAAGSATRTPLFYRIYNESAVLILVLIILLAVFRPF